MSHFSIQYAMFHNNCLVWQMMLIIQLILLVWWAWIKRLKPFTQTEIRTILTGSEIRGITALDVALTFNTPLSDVKWAFGTLSHRLNALIRWLLHSESHPCGSAGHRVAELSHISTKQATLYCASVDCLFLRQWNDRLTCLQSNTALL